MASRLPSWTKVARPHVDILKGRFDLSVFAANLHHVVSGEAAPEYTQPELFFRKTHMTLGLRDLLSDVLARLAELPRGVPVTDIVTSFGGGKTHALIALYHLARGGKKASRWSGVRELCSELGIAELPVAGVAGLVGTHIDAKKGISGEGEPHRKTLWGELAWQLRGAEGFGLVEENDKSLSAPSATTLAPLLGDNKATLILIDEAMDYVSAARAIPAHDSNLGDQTITFLRNLSEVVRETPSAALVVTLPGSYVEIGREDIEDYERLRKRIARVGRPRKLTEGDEIYEIVRRRLFEDSGLERIRRQVGLAYFNLYQKHENELPPGVATQTYMEKIEKAYPFHPELLDILSGRWDTIPQFQKTRGALRMLALLVGDLFRSNDPSPLIQPSSASLSGRDYRTEVVQQIGERRFDTVIEEDIAWPDGRGARIDAEGSETYQREHFAEGVATAIFYYSFGGTAGIPVGTVPQLRLATLRPGLEPAFILDAIEHLRKSQHRLFYLQVEDDTSYRFTLTPNLNAILVDQEASVSSDKIEEFLQQEVNRLARSDRLRLVLFPSEARDISDQPTLALVIMGLDETYGKNTWPATEAKVKELLEGGTKFRNYRNTIVFLLAKENNRMHTEAKSLLALKAVERLYGKPGKLTDSQKRDLADLLSDAQRRLPQSIFDAYRIAVTPGEGDSLEVQDLGHQIHRSGVSLADVVWEHLAKKERLAPKLGPSQLISPALRVWPEDEEVICARELREAFAKYTYLPMLPDARVLQSSIVEGVRQGLFGYGLGQPEKFDVVHFKVGLASEAIELTDTAWLLRPALAAPLAKVEPVVEGEQPEPGAVEEGPPGEVDLIPPSGVCQRVQVKSQHLDWRKWADFYDSVIKPLVQTGAEIEIVVEVDGSSPQGIPQRTVELVIKENLSQYSIDAEVRTE